MLSRYFEIKTGSEDFKKELNELFEKLNGKKVIIYGAGQGYRVLDKEYDFKSRLDVLAIADRKFTEESKDASGLRQIPPAQIKEENFDMILVSNEQPNSVLKYLLNTLEIPEGKIVRVFNEEFKEEALNVNYLYKQKFDRTLPKLIKKMKNKKVVLYGAGLFSRAIIKYFDLSGLNIIGVADKKFDSHEDGVEFCGYKALSPDEVLELKPDYLLISTKYYIAMIEHMHYTYLKGSGIKIKPLVVKSLWTLLREIWI